MFPISKKYYPVALLLGFAGAACAQEAQECKQIRLADIGWTDNAANNGVTIAVARAIGYEPKTTQVSAPIAFISLQKDDLDVFLDYWSPALDSVAKPMIEAGKVSLLEVPNLTGARYTLAVPNYLAEKGLRSFQDLAAFKEELGGKIYGIESGSGGNSVIKKMIAENMYDLSDFKLIESSETAMRMEVARAVKREAPIVFLAWAPHPMNIELPLTYLSGGDDAFGPDYGSATVYSVQSVKFPQRCPNAARLISNMKFDVNMESELMGDILAKKDPVESARAWIARNPQWLDTWLDGVKTFDGKDAKAAAIAHFGAMAKAD